MTIIPAAARGWVRRHLQPFSKRTRQCVTDNATPGWLPRRHPGTASSWVAVGPLDALIPRCSMTTCAVGQQNILVIRSRNDCVFAYLNACPHTGASLSDGDLRGRTLTCRHHGHRFRIIDGAGYPPRRCEHLTRIPAA